MAREGIPSVGGRSRININGAMNTGKPETKEDNNVFSFYVALNSNNDENYISDKKGVLNG